MIHQPCSKGSGLQGWWFCFLLVMALKMDGSGLSSEFCSGTVGIGVGGNAELKLFFPADFESIFPPRLS